MEHTLSAALTPNAVSTTMSEAATLRYRDGKEIGLFREKNNWKLNTALVSDFHASTPEAVIAQFARSILSRDISGALQTMTPERKNSLSQEIVRLTESLERHKSDAVTLLGKNRAELSWSSRGVDYRLVIVRANGGWFVEDLHIKRAPK